MSDLSSDGKTLVQAAKLADRPSDTDRERVLAALRVRLGDAALLSAGFARAPSVTSGGANAAVAVRSPLLKWGWVGSTVAVAGAFWLAPRVWPQGERVAPAPSVSAVSAPSVASAQPQTAPAVGSTEESAPSPSALVTAAASGRAVETQKVAPRARDNLAEEVALLSRAQTELRAGRPAKALLALGEHQRKFPRGALSEERSAARVQALCALGRNDQATAELRQLQRLSPNSAHAERARQACRAP